MSSSPRTLVIVPAYREAEVIPMVVAELVAAGHLVLVVDDGSDDDTAARAATCGAMVVRHPLNLGQGAALQTGFDFARLHGFDRVVTFDADGQHRIEDIPRLCDALDRGADVALGSRGIGAVVGASWTRRMLLRVATWCSNRLSGVSWTDAHCGLRALRVSALEHVRLVCDRMAHATELLTKVAAAGFVAVEVPVVVRYTPYATAKGQRAWGAIRILVDWAIRGPRLGEPRRP